MTLSARYAALKKKVGGNREIGRYEDTFGQPFEEQMNITPINKMNRRILSQVEFAISLSKSLEGKYDSLVEKALDFLENAMEKEGVLTNAVCTEAEEILLPMSQEAKEYKLILAGHAHIDMNWMWSWHETVAATLATFRTMLKIMDEYPDFCFSQSQAAVYKIVEDFEPEMMEKIKELIKEGRWEVTASAWVETDKNMPSTESLIKHIKYTKNYMAEKWGVDPDSLEVDFSPDTFGHSANLPEIDIDGGVKYYYHCRALDGNQALYRWKGPSGKEMLCYREQHWYNSGITPKIGLAVFDISSRCAGFKTGLVVYGVGDHGGGPTRRDVETALEMMSWRVFPTIKFGTVREFFHEAEAVRDMLPVVDHEMNMMFPGCYTTQSRIKLGNRKSEAAFADAEALSALAKLAVKREARTKALERSYRNVLFTHFHDILTGSCVQDSREHAMGLYSEALALANNEYLGAMSKISEATDTSMIVTEHDIRSQSEGAGAGYGLNNFGGKPASESGNGPVRIYTVFNPTSVDKNENVELTVWDYPADMHNIELTNENGDVVEFQLLSHRPEAYWDHRYFKLLANVKAPALGYITLVMRPKEIESYPVYIRTHTSSNKPNENIILDNGIIRAEFNYMNASLVSLIDLESGKEYIESGKSASFVLIDTESSTSNAWNIGKYQKITPVTHITKINGGGGNLRSTLYFEASVMSSKIRAEICLDKGARHFTINSTVDWKEVGGESVPVLGYALPLSYRANDYLYDIPAGTIKRKAMDLDVPALSFAIALADSGRSAGFVNDCKYGYRARKDGTLISTLINSATSPDSYPERGIHKFALSVGIFESNPKLMCDTATSICRKLSYISTTSHKGFLPASGSLLEFTSDSAVLSAATIADDNSSLLLRVFSVGETDGSFEIKFEKGIKTASAVDYLDRAVSKQVCVKGDSLCADIGKFEIVTLKVGF